MSEIIIESNPFGKTEINTGGFSRNLYETPLDFFNKLNNEFNFQVDLSASKNNTKCLKYYDEEQNSLEQDWHKNEGYLWLNPPYSPLKPWIIKAQKEAELGAKIVMLVPPIVTTKYFSARLPEEIRFLVGRLNFWFEGKEYKGNMFDSCLLIFDKTREKKISWYTKNLELINNI